METKPGKSFTSAGVLPSSSESSTISRDGLVGGPRRADDLDQRHHGHRVEEVHPDHTLGPAGHLGQGRDRDRGCVGGEHRLGPERDVGAAEDVLLHAGVLDHGLHHQVGVCQVVHGLDAREHVGGLERRALRRELLEALRHRREPLLDGAGSSVVQKHAAAGCGHHLGDPGSHLAGADHENALERHGAEPTGTRIEPVVYCR